MDSPLFGFYLFAFNFGVLMICTINGITMINHREYPKVCVNLQTDVR